MKGLSQEKLIEQEIIWNQRLGGDLVSEEGIRRGYIEEVIRAEEERAWGDCAVPENDKEISDVDKGTLMVEKRIMNAYLSIDVRPKTGYEAIPKKLQKALSKKSLSHSLREFIEENEIEDVILTDDLVVLNDEEDYRSLLNAIEGKDVQVHLMVSYEKVPEVERTLEKVVKDYLRIFYLLKWRFSDRSYVIELTKRLPDWTEYVVRLYEDGSGVMAYNGLGQLVTHYFKIADSVRDQLILDASEKMDEIVAHPSSVEEDDRWYSSVNLKYNIEWKYPKAYADAKKYVKYETTVYCEDERESEEVQRLLKIPEIKEK